MAAENRCHWHGYVMRMEDSDAWRRAVELEAKAEKDIENAGRGKSMKIGRSREDEHC